MASTLTIIGNGPSTKDVDFSRLTGTTVTLNAAYRKIGDWDWKPDVYCLFDAVLIKTHRQGIIEYIEKNPDKCMRRIKRKFRERK